MRHAYFMLPLEPAHGVRSARTMCKVTVPSSGLAWPMRSTITCHLCKAAALEVKNTYLDLATKVIPGSPGEVQVKRLLQRLSAVLGEDPQSTWHLRYTEHWAERTYYIYERADQAFWAYAFGTEEAHENLYLHPTDARAAARAEIDRILLEEQGL